VLVWCTRSAKTLLTAKVDVNADGRPASVLDTGGDVLVVPQASLSGKLKGNSPQYRHHHRHHHHHHHHRQRMPCYVCRYHAQVAKDKGLELYSLFVTALREEAEGTGNSIKAGVYGTIANPPTYHDRLHLTCVSVLALLRAGNRQAMSTESDGPYTHLFDF
jgi:D-Tyr-tRNAtyr deacylase